MKTHLGWLAFILTFAFAGCLIGTLTLNAWFGVSNERALLGFFGFGIPTVVLGGATASLWEGRKSLQVLLGWAGTMAGLACGVAILILVLSWVLSERGAQAAGASIWRLLGFGATALTCGAFGIATLTEAEKARG